MSVDPWDEERDEEELAAVKLLADLDRHRHARCPTCAVSLCGHAVLCSVALGFKDVPRCPVCLARGLDRSPHELLEELVDYIQRRDCFRRAWDEASEREGLAHARRPDCLARLLAGSVEQPIHAKVERADEEPVTVVSAWDAGHMACGDLVLALRGRMNALQPGDVIKVRALDPAAPEDLPAWCRMTGHSLRQMQPPDYYIQRKEP